LAGSTDEPAEFARLVLEHQDSLYGYARALARHEDEAEDLLQDSLTRAFERFRLFDRSLSFKAWMFTIVRHTYVDQLRRRRARPEEAGWLLGDGEPDAGAESPLYAIPLDPEALLARLESVERVREAIRLLPGPMREVVELRDIEGLSYQEIATVVKRPIGTVMSRLYRGRNLLRMCLVGRDVEKGAETRQGKGAETHHGL
jgi:RNA polymerase sigma-70 factor (ECF subfamily)